MMGFSTIRKLLLPVPGHYARDVMWAQKGASVAADRYTLRSPALMTVTIATGVYQVPQQTDLDLSASASWDSVETDYTVAANRAGKDFYVYACVPAAGIIPVLLLSANSTVPVGYTADNSRKIGGFHTLCVAVGAITNHPLSGHVAGDILPASIWDLSFRPVCSPEGMAYDTKSGIWVDIYLQSGTGASTRSAYNATTTDNRNWMDFVDDLGAVGKRLLTDMEFQLGAAGSNEETNIAGSADPVTTGGHSDTAGRRMISNIGLEDCCGVMNQWLLDQSYRCDPDGTVQAASKTATAYHAAVPGGNPIYVKYLPDGNPYLCCNLATALADKWLTFGTDYKILLVHDVNSAVGGVQVHFDEDATHPGRLLAALGRGKTAYIPSNHPAFMLQIVYHATPATPGVPIRFNDGAANRLEFTSPTSTNGTLDLALNSQGFNWYDLGNKGSIYRQGSGGDVKLLAGGSWTSGTSAGSRCRYAACYRWNTYSTIGARGCARSQ